MQHRLLLTLSTAEIGFKNSDSDFSILIRFDFNVTIICTLKLRILNKNNVFSEVRILSELF